MGPKKQAAGAGVRSTAAESTRANDQDVSAQTDISTRRRFRTTTETWDYLCQTLGKKRYEKRTGGRHTFRVLCPAHNDKRPSLQVTFDQQTEKILLNCYAGCNSSTILLELGLSLADLNPSGGSLIKPKPRQPPPEYIYRNAGGEPYLRKVRLSGPDRPIYHFNGKDWIAGLGGREKIPYNLPELLARRESEIVIVTEGERDADSLMAAGILATTSISRTTAELVPYLKGCRVVIVGDNDKSGREQARRFEAVISEVAESVGTIRLPGIKNGVRVKDVTDFLEAGGTAGELALKAARSLPSPQDGTTVDRAKNARQFQPPHVSVADTRPLLASGPTETLEAVILVLSRFEWTLTCPETAEILESTEDLMSTTIEDETQRDILTVLRTEGPMSKDELREYLHIGRDRNSQAVDDLLAMGKIRPTTNRPVRGNPRRFYLTEKIPT